MALISRPGRRSTSGSHSNTCSNPCSAIYASTIRTPRGVQASDSSGFLMALEHAVQILHHHGITRVVMPFLLGKHQIQRFRRFDRHLAFDRSDSAHSFLHPHTDCPPRAAGLRDGAPSRAFRACGDRPHQHAKGGKNFGGPFSARRHAFLYKIVILNVKRKTHTLFDDSMSK